MPTVHLLHGFVGAGKTTFAAKLARQNCAVVFTPDKWMLRLFGRNPPAQEFADCLARVTDLIFNVASDVLVVDRDVILDFGFWTRLSRDHAREWAGIRGANVTLYQLIADESVLRKRVAQRTTNDPESLMIDEYAFDLFKARFEPLAEDEVHLKVPASGVAP